MLRFSIGVKKAAGRGQESWDLIGRTVSASADNRRVELTVARALLPA